MMNWLIMFLSCSAFKIRHCLPFHLSQSFISKKSILWSKIFFITIFYLFSNPKNCWLWLYIFWNSHMGLSRLLKSKEVEGLNIEIFTYFFSYSYSVKTVLTLKNVKQIVTTQIIWRGQKEGKSAKECQDNFSFLL